MSDDFGKPWCCVKNPRNDLWYVGAWGLGEPVLFVPEGLPVGAICVIPTTTTQEPQAVAERICADHNAGLKLRSGALLGRNDYDLPALYGFEAGQRDGELARLELDKRNEDLTRELEAQTILAEVAIEEALDLVRWTSGPQTMAGIEDERSRLRAQIKAKADKVLLKRREAQMQAERDARETNRARLLAELVQATQQFVGLRPECWSQPAEVGKLGDVLRQLGELDQKAAYPDELRES